MTRRLWLVIGTAIAGVILASETGLFPTLKSDVHTGKQAGFYLLPTNQLLRPWGEQTPIAGRPVDMALDSEKRIIAVLNTASVMLFDALSGAPAAEISSHPTSFAGIAFRPGDRELWASEATSDQTDSLLVIPLSETLKPGEPSRVTFPGHPLPVGIAFSHDGKKAYVAFSRNNTLAVIDAETKTVEREIPVGVAPFSVALADSAGKVFVSNRGGRRPKPGETTSPSSGTQVLSDPVTGTALSGTVSVISLDDFSVREIAVGLAPSGMTLSPDQKLLVVTNGHSDSISIVDSATLARTDVKIPAWPEGTVGSQPTNAVFTPDGKTIYVACGGSNAIAVIRKPGEWRLEGALPTGWFPSAIAVDSQGALRVLNIKGTGNTATKTGAFNSTQYEGTLVKLPSPLPAQLAAGTREVEAANGPKMESTGGISNLPSLGIEHVFLIVKENRTYDQVFGDLPQGNGDPKFVFYGRDITPNHHALAEKYVLLDNFYTGGAISFDGHQWLMQAFVSDYVERAFADSPRGYAWNMADALTVSPAGFFWQGGATPINVRIYGEFSLPGRWDPDKQNVVDIKESDELSWSEYWRLYKEGKWQTAVGSTPGVPALGPYMDLRYPHDSTSIPDQLRADEFLRELAIHEKKGYLPPIIVMTLNSDHTNGTNPGSPIPRAMVADDDLALGRIVEGVSRSRFWAKTLMLVVEDDAQDGLDHVDGHRTVALAIGPHVRRGAVDSNNYNHTSMVRTIQEIFRIEPRTRYLKSARSMHSVFTASVDASPYQTLTPKQALDQMNPPLRTLNGLKLWAARKSASMNWREPDDVPQDVLNRILWWDAKGYDKPYPAPQ